MDREAAFDIIVSQRLALRDHLADLTDEEWETPSLCAGWRVRDVAAHVISSPQLTWGPCLRAVGGMWRGYNGAVLRDGRRRGTAPVAEILAQYDTWAEVRRGPAVVTSVEPLVDVLVHTQDILRPLGRRHPMPPGAAAVAADRARLMAPLFGATRTLRSIRMRATDVDWERGRGPVVEGPMSELLMMCTGRRPDPALVSSGAG